MKTGRHLFAIACALLQVVHVFSNEEVALETDAKLEPVALRPNMRGVVGAISGLDVPVSSPGNSKTLIVKVDKGTNLDSQDALGESDTYVKVTVYQDNWIKDKIMGEDKTSVVKGENPVWTDAEFKFFLPTLNKMRLKLTVMDEDFGLDDKMGDCEINLENEELTATPKRVVKTVNGHWFSEDAKIHVDLSYA